MVQKSWSAAAKLKRATIMIANFILKLIKELMCDEEKFKKEKEFFRIGLALFYIVRIKTKKNVLNK